MEDEWGNRCDCGHIRKAIISPSSARAEVHPHLAKLTTQSSGLIAQEFSKSNNATFDVKLNAPKDGKTMVFFVLPATANGKVDTSVAELRVQSPYSQSPLPEYVTMENIVGVANASVNSQVQFQDINFKDVPVRQIFDYLKKRPTQSTVKVVLEDFSDPELVSEQWDGLLPLVLPLKAGECEARLVARFWFSPVAVGRPDFELKTMCGVRVLPDKPAMWALKLPSEMPAGDVIAGAIHAYAVDQFGNIAATACVPALQILQDDGAWLTSTAQYSSQNNSFSGLRLEGWALA